MKIKPETSAALHKINERAAKEIIQVIEKNNEPWTPEHIDHILEQMIIWGSVYDVVEQHFLDKVNK